MISKFVFWTLGGTIVYVYFGYYFTLKVLSKIIKYEWRKIETNCVQDIPKVSIIIIAYNEENVIKQRIKNIIKSDYPLDKMEILVASDGSTDRTIDIAKQYENYNVKVLDFKENRGRAAVQNDSIKIAKNEIIIFTDAETEFEKDFVSRIVKYFDSKVGCVVGRLIYKSKDNAISSSEGAYWKLETKLRELESSLGILATATGACMSVRKSLWNNLGLIDDSDFTTPLEVILQGYKVVFARDAIAYDVPPSSVKGELKARIRQTSKNFIGTLRRWGIRGWFKHPFVSWGLLSHKLLRWFTPFFMVGAFVSNTLLLGSGLLYQLTFAGQIAFYLIGLIGFLGEYIGRRIPIASTIFSFCVANVGMGIGVIKGLLGKAPAAYKMTE